MAAAGLVLMLVGWAAALSVFGMIALTAGTLAATVGACFARNRPTSIAAATAVTTGWLAPILAIAVHPAAGALALVAVAVLGFGVLRWA